MTAKKTTPAPRKKLPADPRNSAPAAKTPPATAPAPATAAPQPDPIRDASFPRRETHRDVRRKAGAVLVLCEVKNPFKHLTDERSLIDYPAGTYELPVAVLEDSFCKNHGGITPVKTTK
jgi:hypothetical protein